MSVFAAQYCDNAGGGGCETFNEETIGQSLCSAPKNNPDSCEMRLVSGDDFACAEKRVGIPTYTSQLTHFEDTQCARGQCDHKNPGIAHRSWPIGSLVEVCKLGNGSPNSCKCTAAIVIDRGPNDGLGARTIDGNIALTQILGLTGTDPAIYMLLKAPGVGKSVQGANDIVLQPVPGGVQGVNNYSPFAGGGNNYSAPGSFSAPAGMSAGGGVQGGQGGSPFANASPVPFSSQKPVSHDILQNLHGGQTPAQQGPPGPSAGDIILQPRVVTHGRPVIVSWTSVNMNATANCQVVQGGQQFAHGAEGSKSFKTAGAGTLTFILQCTTLTGEQFETRDSVRVQ